MASHRAHHPRRDANDWGAKFIAKEAFRDLQVRGRENGSTRVRNQAVVRAARLVPPTIEFGNIYMMLIVGTTIVEKVIQSKPYLPYPTPLPPLWTTFMLTFTSSKGGARISIQESPQFTMGTADREGADHIMCISPDREIFQKFGGHTKRRIKACMKQIVGGIFTGSRDNRELE